MKLTIEQIAGAWKIEVNGRSEFADSLEELIGKADPGAPLDYVMHTTNILSGVLGIPYEPEFYQPPDQMDFQGLADLLFAGTEEMSDELIADVDSLRGDESEDDGTPNFFFDPADGVVKRIEEYTGSGGYDGGASHGEGEDGPQSDDPSLVPDEYPRGV